MRTEFEKLIYNTDIDWPDLPMPISRQELKRRLACRLLPCKSVAKLECVTGDTSASNPVENASKTSP